MFFFPEMILSSSPNVSLVNGALSLLFCRGESCCIDASVGQRGEAHCGGRAPDRATAGPPTGRGAPLQRLHPPTVESKETIQSRLTYNKCRAPLIHMLHYGSATSVIDRLID